MKNLGLLTMITLTLLFGGACQKQATSAANTSANTVGSTGDGNVNQIGEQVSATKGLKPSEPCGWFEESLGIKAEEYEELERIPGKYWCFQLKSLDSGKSHLSYTAGGDAKTINEFSASIRVPGQYNAKQKENLHTMLALAAMEIADRASEHKLTKEILAAILAGDTKEFTLEPNANSTKPQLKTVSVENNPRLGKSYEVDITLSF